MNLAKIIIIAAATIFVIRGVIALIIGIIAHLYDRKH